MPIPTPLPTPFTLTYDPTTRRLRGCWAAPVTEQVLRAHYADLLAQACAHDNCRFWLLDLRQRDWHAPSFGRWYTDAFAPAAQAALPRSLFIAYVLSSAHCAIANTPDTQATQRGCAAHDVYPFFFDNELDASEWLTHQQSFEMMG